MVRERNKQGLKWVLVIIGLFSILISTAFVIYKLTPVPPEEKIEKARHAISDARKARANYYAPLPFKKAESLYDSAIGQWQIQNKRFMLNRNFDAVAKYSDLAIYKANEAKNKALTHSGSLEISLKAEIKTLNGIIEKFGKYYGNLPLPAIIRQDYEKGKMLLSEGSYDYKNKDYLLCKKKVTSAKKYLNDSFNASKKLLIGYFENYNSWVAWQSTTIKNSKTQRTYAIIVDKFSKKCYVYKHGKLKTSFDVELGKNWMGHKRYKGDKATPEGLYKITNKLQKDKTKYYKALLINYPNDIDRMRFDKEIKQGTLSKKSAIGGLIEIHGGGGRGVDWTDGCIALRDEDMDALFRLADIGTPVTIVGSLHNLSEIIDL